MKLSWIQRVVLRDAQEGRMTTRTRRSGHESHHSANGGMIGFRTVDSLIREPALMARGDSERDGNGVTTTKWQLTDTGLSSLATGRRA